MKNKRKPVTKTALFGLAGLKYTTKSSSFMYHFLTNQKT